MPLGDGRQAFDLQRARRALSGPRAWSLVGVETGCGPDRSVAPPPWPPSQGPRPRDPSHPALRCAPGSRGVRLGDSRGRGRELRSCPVALLHEATGSRLTGVRAEGVEPSPLSGPGPKPGASAISPRPRPAMVARSDRRSQATRRAGQTGRRGGRRCARGQGSATEPAAPGERHGASGARGAPRSQRRQGSATEPAGPGERHGASGARGAAPDRRLGSRA